MENKCKEESNITLIDHYERKGNHIFIYYSDGHYRTEEYTKIKEREIISKKLEQLLDQVENLPIVKSEIVKNIIEELIAIVTTSGDVLCNKYL